MKKQVILCCCNMGVAKEKTKYEVADNTMNVSEEKFRYPLNAYLQKNITSGEEAKIVLIAKKDSFNRYEQNVVDFTNEVNDINKSIGAKIEIKVLVTDFSFEKGVHHDLLDAIVDEIEEDSVITADITFGPKDVPIVTFAALNFAEKYLNCEVNRILYGKADFNEFGKPVNNMIWDLSTTYYINSISNKINCEDPKKARMVLKKLLSI